MKTKLNYKSGKSLQELAEELEIDNTIEYLEETYMNGNFQSVIELFNELNLNAQKSVLANCGDRLLYLLVQNL